MTGGIGSRTDYSLARRKTEAEVDRATGLRRQMASRSRTAARNNPQAGFLKCERDRQGEISDLHVNGGERRGHFSGAIASQRRERRIAVVARQAAGWTHAGLEGRLERRYKSA